jgi:hypothetical protein
MLYVIIGNDRPGALEDRLAARPDHLAHWQSLGDGLKAAGPFLDAFGKPCGSLIIADIESEAAAQRHADADPYSVRGVFESKTVRPWNWAINPPEGV